ncbi:MAG: hypothetical protein WC763_00960 [Candidatus Paceibacterota bacterium]|jgi:DNA-binding NarL/FixJ family response regulator
MPTWNVLLIEDDLKQVEEFKAEMADYPQYQATYAMSLAEAVKLIPSKQWHAVSVDGCLGGDIFNSLPLIRMLKEKGDPDCVIIAASSSPYLGEEMLAAGCTHMARKKDHVPDLIHSILRRR